jgi:YD repeat-containing protein
MKIRVQAILLALSVFCFCGGNVYAIGPETKPNTHIVIEWPLRPFYPYFPIIELPSIPPVPPPPPGRGGGKEDPPFVCDPIGLVDGAVMESVVDVRVPCPGVDLVFKRSYSSSDGPWCELALGWSHSYSFAVGWASSNKVCVARSADPSVEGYAAPVTFPLPDKGGVSCAEGGPYRLFRNDDETLRFLTPDGLSYNFDTTGRLVSVVHISGATVSLSRDEHGRLVRAEHSNGKSLSFGYSPAGRLVSVSTPDSDFAVHYHYRSVNAPAAGRSYDLLEKVETVFHGRVDTARYAYSPDPPPGKTGVSAPPGIASRAGAGARLGGVSATAVAITRITAFSNIIVSSTYGDY